ncbi:GNAT family N-acetyltransferase [Lysinibacillus xylanilyticus]|uniref:GNAT family N-acetyltransferase n=1 Tax=Lysinibacillus xylanilyticus TaxID=582475 RepID=UPI00380DBC73
MSVSPEHRSKGVGKLVLQWAKNFARTHSQSNELSLHVASSNSRQFYELISFRAAAFIQ